MVRQTNRTPRRLIIYIAPVVKLSLSLLRTPTPGPICRFHPDPAGAGLLGFRGAQQKYAAVRVFYSIRQQRRLTRGVLKRFLAVEPHPR